MVLKVTCGCEATRVTAGERSDTETVTLREARGDGKRAISTSPVAYSTSAIRSKKGIADVALRSFTAPSLYWADGHRAAYVAVYCSVLERIAEVASAAGRNGDKPAVGLADWEPASCGNYQAATGQPGAR